MVDVSELLVFATDGGGCCDAVLFLVEGGDKGGLFCEFLLDCGVFVEFLL